MNDLISRQAAIDAISSMFAPTPTQKDMVEDCLEIIENLPSAQFKRTNKGTHGITESDRISYAVICDKFPSPHVYFNTYDEAEHWARYNQPNYRPYYIVERSEHFEIVGEVR